MIDFIMATKEQLERRVKELEDELKASKESKFFLKQERKVRISNPDEDDIKEWIIAVQDKVSRYATEAAKVQTILELLDRRAKTEVHFRCNTTSASSGEVLDILSKVYKSSSSVVKLQ